MWQGVGISEFTHERPSKLDGRETGTHPKKGLQWGGQRATPPTVLLIRVMKSSSHETPEIKLNL